MDSSTFQHEAEVLPVAEHLPVWWRCILIAVAMVILNACAEPVRTHLSPDKSLVPPQGQVSPPVMEQIIPTEPGEIVQNGLPVVDGGMVSDQGVEQAPVIMSGGGCGCDQGPRGGCSDGSLNP